MVSLMLCTFLYYFKCFLLWCPLFLGLLVPLSNGCAHCPFQPSFFSPPFLFGWKRRSFVFFFSPHFKLPCGSLFNLFIIYYVCTPFHWVSPSSSLSLQGRKEGQRKRRPLCKVCTIRAFFLNKQTNKQTKVLAFGKGVHEERN